jgi:pilus assembly protein CpaB
VNSGRRFAIHRQIRRRTLVNKRALVISMAVALLGAVLLFLYLRRFEREASGGAPVTVLVALKPIEPGTVLTEAMLAPRDVPVAYVESRAVRATEKARAIGLRVSNRVQPSQTLMWTDMAITADDRRDLSSLVEPGMRAVTIRAKSGGSDRANELIRPGDRVDVVVTTGGGSDREPQTSTVLMQNVLVLAVGLDTGSDSGEKRSGSAHDSLLTLSLTIREAQLQSLAAEKGRISVALRNPDDVRVIDGLADVTSSALLDPRLTRVAAPASGADAPQTPNAPVRLERAQIARVGGHR